jgi:hypothetical protein
MQEMEKEKERSKRELQAGFTWTEVESLNVNY